MSWTPGTDVTTSPGSTTLLFGTQAERWLRLYALKSAFKDRLALFTENVKAVLPPGSRVFDFGCGPGVMSLALAGMGYDVLAVDGAPEMIEIARAEARRLGTSRVNFAVKDASNLRVEPEAYDGVICSSVLEYVADDAALVAALVRALRPGGYLLISVPHTDSALGRIEDLVMRIGAYVRSAGRRHLAFSLRRYKRGHFLQMLEAAGLGSFACTYFDAPLFAGLGVTLSRFRRVGRMLLVIGRKRLQA